MVVFITGPSGSGKSTLRDYYCRIRGIKPIAAVTTRPLRKGEIETHKSIGDSHFKELLNKQKLCLVSQNHGFWYGYEKSAISQTTKYPMILEVDSQTAIRESVMCQALVLRVIPCSIARTLHLIKQKRDGIEDRLKDLEEQTDETFLSRRIEVGDLVFVNEYDNASKERFLRLLDSLTEQNSTYETSLED